VVVLVSLVTRGSIKGDLIVGLRIGKTFSQESGDVVVEVESKSAALRGDHLERQIPWYDLTRFPNAFNEVLIVGSAQLIFGRAQRINAVQRDACL
jgi:hypothetical protein